MDKKIIFLVALCVLFSGCGITGNVVQQLDSGVEAQLEKDYIKIVDALDQKDYTICYDIMTQNIREDCFMRLAKNTKDKSVCKNLLPGLRADCLAQFD